jgi:hypothetical protein
LDSLSSRAPSRALTQEPPIAAAAPVAVLSQPWSQLAPDFTSGTEGDSRTIYRGALLHPDYWLRYLIYVSGYLLNLFLGAAGLHAGGSWIRRR